MIKLLLAIKKRGVDIDRIYNHDVVNEDANNSSDAETPIPNQLFEGDNSLYDK